MMRKLTYGFLPSGEAILTDRCRGFTYLDTIQTRKPTASALHPLYYTVQQISCTRHWIDYRVTTVIDA